MSRQLRRDAIRHLGVQDFFNPNPKTPVALKHSDFPQDILLPCVLAQVQRSGVFSCHIAQSSLSLQKPRYRSLVRSREKVTTYAKPGIIRSISRGSSLEDLFWGQIHGKASTWRTWTTRTKESMTLLLRYNASTFGITPIDSAPTFPRLSC